MMLAWVARSAAVSAVALAVTLACGAADGIGPDGVLGCGPLYLGDLKVPPPPDGAALCGAGPCNYQTQAGCGTGEACLPSINQSAHTAEPVCRPEGTLAAGETCDDTRRCARGTMCIKSPSTAATGTCRKLCCGADWSACDEGESCIRQLDATAQDGTRFYAEVDLCFPVGTCNVLDADDCADEGRNCRIVDPTGAVACAPPSTLKKGDPCSKAEQCGPVLHCVAEDGSKPGVDGPLTCRKLCPWAKCADTGCEADEKCVHFGRDPPGVGECTKNWKGEPLAEDAGIPDAARPPN